MVVCDSVLPNNLADQFSSNRWPEHHAQSLRLGPCEAGPRVRGLSFVLAATGNFKCSVSSGWSLEEKCSENTPNAMHLVCVNTGSVTLPRHVLFQGFLELWLCNRLSFLGRSAQISRVEFDMDSMHAHVRMDIAQTCESA